MSISHAVSIDESLSFTSTAGIRLPPDTGVTCTLPVDLFTAPPDTKVLACTVAIDASDLLLILSVDGVSAGENETVLVADFIIIEGLCFDGVVGAEVTILALFPSSVPMAAAVLPTDDSFHNGYHNAPPIINASHPSTQTGSLFVW